LSFAPNACHLTHEELVVVNASKLQVSTFSSRVASITSSADSRAAPSPGAFGFWGKSDLVLLVHGTNSALLKGALFNSVVLETRLFSNHAGFFSEMDLNTPLFNQFLNAFTSAFKELDPIPQPQLWATAKLGSFLAFPRWWHYFRSEGWAGQTENSCGSAH
jgi:hypothetical protein